LLVLFTWVLLDLWNPNRAATFEAIARKRGAERHAGQLTVKQERRESKTIQLSG
jgi:hypothetical protein